MAGTITFLIGVVWVSIKPKWKTIIGLLLTQLALAAWLIYLSARIIEILQTY